MKILVTGATGFIGTNLTRELRKEHELFILGQFEGDPEKLGLSGIVMTKRVSTPGVAEGAMVWVVSLCFSSPCVFSWHDANEKSTADAANVYAIFFI